MLKELLAQLKDFFAPLLEEPAPVPEAVPDPNHIERIYHFKSNPKPDLVAIGPVNQLHTFSRPDGWCKTVVLRHYSGVGHQPRDTLLHAAARTLATLERAAGPDAELVSDSSDPVIKLTAGPDGTHAWEMTVGFTVPTHHVNEHTTIKDKSDA